MSFFKKMTTQFDDLKSTFTKSDEKKEEKHGGKSSRAEPKRTINNKSHSLYLVDMQHSTEYGQPPSTHGAPYGGPPAPGPPGPPSMDQPLPPGWVKQWDSNSQRWYFVEQATGRTQWELPAQMGQIHGHQGQNYGQQGIYPPTGGQHSQPHDPATKDKGMGTMGAAAGGLAVGAIGGGLIGHAMGKHIPPFILRPQNTHLLRLQQTQMLEPHF